MSDIDPKGDLGRLPDRDHAIADTDPVASEGGAWRAVPDWPRLARPGPRQHEPEPRHPAELRAHTTSIDALRDAEGTTFFGANEDARTVNVSVGGLCLRCEREPWVGSRLLVTLYLNEEERPIELAGQVRWTRVELERGAHGGRPVALVGIELVDGAEAVPESYRHALERLELQGCVSVAGREALG